VTFDGRGDGSPRALWRARVEPGQTAWLSPCREEDKGQTTAPEAIDGLLDIRLSTLGSARIGANPEQLFAAAWSASLESAIVAAARRRMANFGIATLV
jgi:organic hydroperoxide reductase OsmC/OhrA